MIFLDTSVAVDFLREQRRCTIGPAHRKLQALRQDETPCLSLFVVCELEVGAFLAQRSDEIERVRLFCRNTVVVYPDLRFAHLYAKTLAKLKRQGHTIPTMDLLIATTALLEESVLITRNRKDFEKIPGLQVEGY